MIKKMNPKWMLTTALVAAISCTVISCSDDEETKPTNQEVNLDPYGKTTEEGNACYNLLSQLSVVGDSLPNDWKTHSFKTLEGTVLDESQPFVRSIAIDDMDAALQYFNDLTGVELGSAKTYTWTMKDVGTLTFTPLDKADCIATIDVKVNQLKDLTQLRLVPVSAIPFNAAFEGDPWYRLGDVVRDSEGAHWICVRPCYQPSKIDQSWWVSFNIPKNCMPEYPKPGLQKQYIPYNLGNKKLSRAYAAQLLNVLSHPSDFQRKYASSTFGEKGKGLSGLPEDAMPYENFSEIAANWDKNDIWNKVKPSGMTVSEFQSYFGENLTMIYNTHHIQSATLIIDISQFSGANDFYRSAQKDTEATFNMQNESFNITTYASRGTGTAAAIGSKALVIRYKDGKSLSNTRSMENISPTKPIEGTTDVYRFEAAK